MLMLCGMALQAQGTSQMVFPQAEWSKAGAILMHTTGPELFNGVIHPSAGLGFGLLSFFTETPLIARKRYALAYKFGNKWDSLPNLYAIPKLLDCSVNIFCECY